MKNQNLVLGLFTISMFVAGCTKETTQPLITQIPNEDAGVLINPNNANALSQVLIMPAGTQQVEGTPPNPTNSNQSPQVETPVDSLNTSNGSTAALPISYSNVSGNLNGCYLQVVGSDNYFTIPYNSNSGNSGDLQVPIEIPTNVDEGTFCLSFSTYDTNGFVSNVVETCINVLRLGTGELQISLSWSNGTDQDLYVIDPSGTEISFSNKESDTGGILDRDDMDGFGPENIFWSESAPDGNYSIRVNDFSNVGEQNTFIVTINGAGQSRSFNGTTQNGSTADVTSFTKSGNSISYF